MGVFIQKSIKQQVKVISPRGKYYNITKSDKYMHSLQTATYPYAWDIVSTSIVAGGGRGLVHTGAHTITIVLTDKHSWQGHQLGHVVGFKHLTLKTNKSPLQYILYY